MYDDVMKILIYFHHSNLILLKIACEKFRTFTCSQTKGKGGGGGGEGGGVVVVVVLPSHTKKRGSKSPPRTGLTLLNIETITILLFFSIVLFYHFFCIGWEKINLTKFYLLT